MIQFDSRNRYAQPLNLLDDLSESIERELKKLLTQTAEDPHLLAQNQALKATLKAERDKLQDLLKRPNTNTLALRDLQQKLKGKETEACDYKAEAAQLRQLLMQKDGEFNKEHFQNAQVQSRLRQQEFMITHLTQQLATKDRKILEIQQDFDRENQKLRHQLRSTQQILSDNEIQAFKKGLELQRQKQKYSIVKGELDKVLADKTKQEVSTTILAASSVGSNYQSKYKQQIYSLKEKIATLTTENKEISKYREELIRTKADFNKQIQDLQSQLQLQRDQQKNLQARLQKAVSIKNQLQKEKVKRQQQETNKPVENHDKQKESRQNNQLKQEISQLKSQTGKLGDKIRNLQREKESLRDELYDKQKMIKKMKMREQEKSNSPAPPVSAQKEKEKEKQDHKTNIIIRMLTENNNNLVQNLDNQRARNNELQKIVAKLQKTLSFVQNAATANPNNLVGVGVPSDRMQELWSNWLWAFYESHQSLTKQIELQPSEDLQAINQILAKQLKSRKENGHITDCIEESTLQAIQKIKQLKRTTQSGNRANALLLDKAHVENKFLKVIINSGSAEQGLNQLTKLLSRFQKENKFIDRKQFFEMISQRHDSELKQVSFQDNQKLSQSFVKTIFIFLEDIIKVFDGNFPCQKMMTDIQEHLRGGLSTERQQKVSLLLQNIKDWLIGRIKNFRKKLSRIVLHPIHPTDLTPITQQQYQASFPSKDLLPLHSQIEQLQTKLRHAEKKARKLADEVESMHSREQIVRKREGELDEKAETVFSGQLVKLVRTIVSKGMEFSIDEKSLTIGQIRILQQLKQKANLKP